MQSPNSTPQHETVRAGLDTRAQRGRRDTKAIPDRIRDHIQRRQDSSEILIGWVQLGVTVLFGTLYFVSPKTAIDATIQPVPWVLALYLAFTLLRLLLAYRQRLPNWMLVLSIIVDMTLLMALIWSFHIQYEQPPSFYLKVPTLLYVFVFISLRALRFEATYVVLAGVFAAIGWLINVAYAVYVDTAADRSMPMLTRDYIEYMTSNSILIGAELDKIISILVVTGIIAFAISRARATMIEAAVVESAAENLSRFVPEEVARNIIESNEDLAAGHSESGEATILFVDIEDFTRIGERLSPEMLVRTLNDYFAHVCEPIERMDGVVTQFQGDAILASFNMPKKNPNHAANAIATAVEIHRALANARFANGLQLKARVGINTGLVVGGLVGTEDRVSYTVHGDAVNLAARLEQKNKELGTRTLVAKATVDAAGSALGDAIALRDLGDNEIRGHLVPVPVLAVET